MDAPAYFGVAGWSYPDWRGIVYPPGLKTADQLSYLARFVDLIEVNTSFYRIPTSRTVEGWLRRTEQVPAFFFTAKVPGTVTHEGELGESGAQMFRDAFAPLIEAGRLRQLLAQFRWDFADTHANRDFLGRLVDLYSRSAPIVVELRHNSWQAPAALEALASLGVTVANLDMPLGRDSFSLELCRVGVHRYLRLHGRNRKAWFDKKAGRDETYDYLYSPDELAHIQARLLALRQHAKSITVVANNHFRGKEVANTLELKSLATGTKVDVPPSLVLEYPRLRNVCLE